MKCFFNLLLFILFFTDNVSAQKNNVKNINWKVAGELPPLQNEVKALGVAGALSGVHNNVLLVGGGANFPDALPWLGGKKKYHNEVYVFQKKDDALVYYKNVKLPFSIAYSGVFSTPHGILSVGGENENGITNKAFLLQWDNLNETVFVKELPNFPFAVSNSMVIVFNDKVYVAGGERASDVSGEFLVLDLNDVAKGWQNLAPLPNPVSHSVMVLQSNSNGHYIYLIGGRKRNPGSTSTLYKTVLQYNIKEDQWVEKESIPYPLSAGSGVVINHNNILLFGGDAGEAFHKTESLIAAISKEANENKKAILNEEKIKVQSTHPGFCKQVFMYDTVKDSWRKLNCLPFSAPVTTTAVVWDEAIIIPSGEIKAGIRTSQILYGKLVKKIKSAKIKMY